MVKFKKFAKFCRISCSVNDIYIEKVSFFGYYESDFYLEVSENLSVIMDYLKKKMKIVLSV